MYLNMYFEANFLDQGAHMEWKQIRVPSLSKMTSWTFLLWGGCTLLMVWVLFLYWLLPITVLHGNRLGWLLCDPKSNFLFNSRFPHFSNLLKSQSFLTVACAIINKIYSPYNVPIFGLFLIYISIHVNSTTPHCRFITHVSSRSLVCLVENKVFSIDLSDHDS